MTLTDQLPTLRPVRDKEDLGQLLKAAAADNHLVLAPTVIIEKAGETAGYLGLNSIPFFQGWFDTQRINARDSALIFNQVENFCRMRGNKQLLLLLPTTSPFRNVMDRFDYLHLADAGMHLKQL